MPFTFAHGAAALPLRRTPLIFSALIVGCFAPDFEYFLRLAPRGSFGHTLPGLFVLDLPLSLIVLWLFHFQMKGSTQVLLPDGLQQRLRWNHNTFTFWSPIRFVLIVVSILIGAASHIVWDSFTHPTFWPYRHLSVLSREVHFPIVGTVEFYKLLQHGSTLAGGIALLVCFTQWYRNTPVDEGSVHPARTATGVMLLCIALSGAIVRAFIGVGVPRSIQIFEIFLAELVITSITIVWFELLIFAILITSPRAA